MGSEFLTTLRNSFSSVFKHLTSKKMKIGISCRSALGGSSLAAVKVAEGLAKKGHEVHLIVHGKPFRFNQKLGIKIHRIAVQHKPIFANFPDTIVIASKMVEIAEKEKLDILNVHYAIPYSVSAYLAKMMLRERNLKIKIITTLHGTDAHTYGKKKEFKDILRFVLDESDGIIAVSNFIANQTLEFGIKKKVKVIPNFIDSKRFCKKDEKKAKKFKEKFALPKEKILLHVSTFRKIKRIEDIIRAFNIVKSKIKAKLILVGGGPEKRKIINLVKRLKLSKKVIFVGSQKKVEKYYEIADLFVLASEKEGLPLSILEAMSMEVPVVSTDVGGISEEIEDGINGFLVPGRDVRAFADACVKVLSNNSLKEKMGESAREKLLNLFTEQKVISAYENYYKEILLLS